MKPVVVAWALLFVVAVGVLYRFGSWIGRRRRRSPRHSTKAEESDETPPDPKTTETPPVVGGACSGDGSFSDETRDAEHRCCAGARCICARSSSASRDEHRGGEAATTTSRDFESARPTSGLLPITLPPRLQRYCGRASARRCSRPSPQSRLLEAGRLRCHRGLERRQLQRSRRVPKLRKFGQTFRRQCRPVRSRVRLQQTSRRPQSPNRHSTHRKQTCSKRVYLRASHAARVRHEAKFCPHLPNIGALRFAPAKLAQAHRPSACE